MSYSFESRIRYSEVGEDDKLTLFGIINYFQDASTFQSEDLGLGVEMLRARGRGWVLSSWQIVVERYPSLGEWVEVSTWAYDFRRFLGNRNFTMKTREGEMLACANTIWSYMDLKKGRPVQIDEDILKIYAPEPRLDMEYAPRKIPVPGESVAMEPFPVRAHHLDTNHHVNNGQYVQMAREFIPQEYVVHQMRAEYKKPAVKGDIITPRVHCEKDIYTIALCSGEEPYAVVEFSRKG